MAFQLWCIPLSFSGIQRDPFLLLLSLPSFHFSLLSLLFIAIGCPPSHSLLRISSFPHDVYRTFFFFRFLTVRGSLFPSPPPPVPLFAAHILGLIHSSKGPLSWKNVTYHSKHGWMVGHAPSRSRSLSLSLSLSPFLVRLSLRDFSERIGLCTCRAENLFREFS